MAIALVNIRLQLSFTSSFMFVNQDVLQDYLANLQYNSVPDPYHQPLKWKLQNWCQEMHIFLKCSPEYSYIYEYIHVHTHPDTHIYYVCVFSFGANNCC